MKLKIGIMMIFLILSINNISCEIGAFTSIGSITETFTTTGLQWEGTRSISLIQVKDIQIGNIDKVIAVIPSSNWMGSTAVTSSWDTSVDFYTDGNNYIGSGILGWNKDNDNYYHVIAFLQDTDITGLSGQKEITWSGYDGYSMAIKYYKTEGLPTNEAAAFSINNSGTINRIVSSENTIIRNYYFINTYEYTKTNLYYLYEMNRTTTYTSKIKIEDNVGNIIVDETSLQTLDYEYLSYDLDNYTWTITNENKYGDIEVDIIDFSLLEDEIDDNTPTLTTDKTYYNTSETITINYTNIQKIYDECTGYTYNHKCEHPYELYILYPIYSDNPYNQWGAKYQMYIPYYYATDGTGIKYDNGNITLNTSILSPQNTYVLALVGKNGYYGKTDDILLMSNSFTVYPANEYLNTNCEGRSTYNECDIIIYYKINNNSNIIIKDNDNNIINQYYNIIDEGELIYTIPKDLEHLNTYPNWKIYLNNTDYVTSYNQDLTVYWSLFESPTETPTISPTETPDINISVQLDDLNTEVKPLKELLFGLVYIVVDNPDYNTDNIVSENEINNWLNSIIPLCLFLCLIILYIGLHKKRE